MLYARLPREHTRAGHAHITKHVDELDFRVSTHTPVPAMHVITLRVSAVMDRPEKYFASPANIQDCCHFSSNLLRQAGGHSQAGQSHLCLGATQETAAQLLKLLPDCSVLHRFYPLLNPTEDIHLFNISITTLILKFIRSFCAGHVTGKRFKAIYLFIFVVSPETNSRVVV